MELQTVVGIEKPDFQIGYTTSILMLGSCFVENMGARLEYFKFQADINPCGIVYNPCQWLVLWRFCCQENGLKKKI